MIESDSKRPVLRETRTEPRGAVWFLSIKAAGRDGALAQVNLENSPTHDLSRIGNEKRPSLTLGNSWVHHAQRTFAEAAGHTPITFGHFSVVVVACLMAYNGWSYVSFVTGEVRNPQRNLLRALVIGMVAVAFLYVLANLAYMRVMTIPEIATTERVGADLATRTMGSIGGTFVSLTVLLSIIGAVNGCILTAARLPFAQARDQLFFARFGEIHPHFQTPATAIVWGGVWTAILVLSGSYETLYTYSILAAWVFYSMSVAAVFVLRRKAPQAARPTGCGATLTLCGFSWRCPSGSW